MQSAKETLEYVCNVLNYFGLTTPSQSEFQQAKFDEGDEVAINKFILLIYELSLFHIGENKFKFTKIDKEFENIGQKLESIKKFIIHYLYTLKCPFLIQLGDKVILKTSSTRNLLLLVGWLIYQTNLFEIYTSCILEDTQQYFSRFMVYKPTFDDCLIERDPTDNVKNIIKCDMNDVISGYKKIKHLYKKLAKLHEYEYKRSSQIQKSIELAQGELTFNEYQFLKKKENLALLAKDFEAMNRTLDYEISHIKQREIFWSWMESVIDKQKKAYGNDPDFKFEDNVSIEDLNSLEKSPVTPLQKLEKDLEGIFKTHEEFKDKFREFEKMWDEERQNLAKKENLQLNNQLKNQAAYLMKEFQQKYPPLESLKKTTEGLGIFFGEIASHLQSILKENKEENYLEIQKLSSEIIKVKEDSKAFQGEVEQILLRYTELLPGDIKVFNI